jgi:hypothetical protein
MKNIPNYYSLVPQLKTLLPEHIIDSESNLLVFLEAYYEWMEQRDNVVGFAHVLNETDITQSVLDFYEFYKAEFFPMIPNEMLADKAQVVRHIRELYRAKGSPSSFKLLFRILYNEEIELFFPETQIFRSSTAKWNRDASVRFTIRSGVLTSFEGIQGNLFFNDISIPVNISKIQKVAGTVNIFEAFIETKFEIKLPVGATLETSSFVGDLVPALTKYSIIEGGLGYSVGDIIDIPSQGNQTKIKVTKVSSTGSIKSIQIVQFGSEEYESLSFKIGNNGVVSYDLDYTNVNQYTGSTELSDDVSLLSFVDGETNYIYEYDKERVISDTKVNISLSNKEALIVLWLGFYIEYPGYYSNNVGFPSDASYIQDGYYYQQFSYVIKSNQGIENYKDNVTSLIHPAGTKMFSDYIISRKIDILVSIVTQLNELNSSFSEFVSASDSEIVKIFQKALGESVIVTDEVFKDRGVNLTGELIRVIDSELLFGFFKELLLEDIAKALDSISQKEVGKVLSENISFLETNSKNVTKPFSEEFNISENPIRTIIKAIQEAFSITEAYAYDIESMVVSVASRPAPTGTSINNVNLSSQGNIDWHKPTTNAFNSGERKSGAGSIIQVELIKDPSSTETNSFMFVEPKYINFSWSGGTPTTSGNNDDIVSRLSTSTNGIFKWTFKVSVPMDVVKRYIKYYFMGYISNSSGQISLRYYYSNNIAGAVNTIINAGQYLNNYSEYVVSVEASSAVPCDLVMEFTVDAPAGGLNGIAYYATSVSDGNIVATPLLSVTSAQITATSTFNLSTLGLVDWHKPTSTAYNSGIRKLSGGASPILTYFGTTDDLITEQKSTTLTWTQSDSTPNTAPNTTNTKTVVRLIKFFSAGTEVGWKVSIPTTPSTRRIKLYFMGYKQTSASSLKLSVSFADGSGTPHLSNPPIPSTNTDTYFEVTVDVSSPNSTNVDVNWSIVGSGSITAVHYIGCAISNV